MALVAGACTSFGAVRSAEVTPGPSFELRGTLATPPGDLAAWFWSLDCAEACNHSIIGGELAYSYGAVPAQGGTPFELGLGLSGIFPFAQGYIQLAKGPRPFGVGARLGLPVGGWSEHQVFGRMDMRLKEDERLVLNPTLFLHTGRSPNGQDFGHVVGLLGGVGLESTRGGVTALPAVTLGGLWTERTRYGDADGPLLRPVAVFSMSVRVHRSRE